MKMTKRVLTVLLVLVGSALYGVTQVISASAGTGQDVPTSPDPFAGYVTPAGPEMSLDKIVAVAETGSAEAGQPNPSISEGKGTLQAAMRTIDSSANLPGQTSPGYRAMLATPVDLIVMEGHFTLTDALVPAGHPMPSGTTLDLVIDSHTGSVIGRALPTPEQQRQQREATTPVASAASDARIAVRPLTGVVAGRLYVSGGPAHAGGGLHPADRFPVVVTRGSHTVARTTTTRHGGFSVHLKPGRYALAGRTGGCKARNIVVKLGQTTHTSLYCSLL